MPQAFSKVLRWQKLRHALTRCKTEVQNPVIFFTILLPPSALRAATSLEREAFLFFPTHTKNGRDCSLPFFCLNHFLSPQEQLLLPHCLAWGQPIQCCPRFFARMRKATMPPAIASKMRITIASVIGAPYAFFSLRLVRMISAAITDAITATAIPPPMAAPTDRVAPVATVPMV